VTQTAVEGAGTPGAVGGDIRRYLMLTIEGERYAVDILDVREIIKYRPPTTVPMAPGYIQGVINLRGRVLPVVDLVTRLGRGSSRIGRNSAIVVLQRREGGAAGQGVGIVVEAVNKVLHLADDDIQPPTGAGGDHPLAELVRGMVREDDLFVLVMDADHVIALNDVDPRALGGVMPSSADPAHG
jgi:purine-binding chemotaxis protein CheW